MKLICTENSSVIRSGYMKKRACVCWEGREEVERKEDMKSFLSLFLSPHSPWICFWLFGPAFPRSNSKAHNFWIYKSNGPVSTGLPYSYRWISLAQPCLPRLGLALLQLQRPLGRFIEGFCNEKGSAKTLKSIMELAYERLNLMHRPKYKEMPLYFSFW